jgi:hypothetical protein
MERVCATEKCRWLQAFSLGYYKSSWTVRTRVKGSQISRLGRDHLHPYKQRELAKQSRFKSELGLIQGKECSNQHGGAACLLLFPSVCSDLAPVIYRISLAITSSCTPPRPEHMRSSHCATLAPAYTRQQLGVRSRAPIRGFGCHENLSTLISKERSQVYTAAVASKTTIKGRGNHLVLS